MAATILFLGTLFFRAPQALGGLAAEIPAFLGGWIKASGVPLLRLPAALLVYNPLVVIFGLVGAYLAWEKPQPGRELAQFLSRWAGVALLVALLYPGRQPADLAWVLVPLWCLAAIAIDRLAFNRDERALTLPALGQSAMIVILVAFMAIEMSGFLRFTETLAFWRVGVLLAGAVALIGLTTTLVGMGLNWPTGRLGLVWGLGLVLFVYGLSQTLNYSGPSLDGPRGLWAAAPAPGQASRLEQTIQDVSTWQTGMHDSLEVVSLVDSPSLDWALREWPLLRHAPGLAAGEMPPVVISGPTEALRGASTNYLGQDFAWEISPAWSGIFPPGLPAWLVTRSAPVNEQQLILWVRADLFPGE